MAGKFDIEMNNPDLISWAQKVNERNDAKAKESRENMMNMMKAIGLAAAAYQGEESQQDPRQSVKDYYNANWSNYSPEDQVALVNLGFNPSLYNGMNPQLSGTAFGG